VNPTSGFTSSSSLERVDRGNDRVLTASKGGQVGAVTGVIIAVVIVIGLVVAGLWVKRGPVVTASYSQEQGEIATELLDPQVSFSPDDGFTEIENPNTALGTVINSFVPDTDEFQGVGFT
jgi:hypothetical protein